MRLFAVAALLLLTGCTTEKDGVVRHVVIGFGVVSVNKTNLAAQVVTTKALGVYCANSPGTFSVGYVNKTTTSIQTNSNVIVEVK